jgi:hypothetical protein
LPARSALSSSDRLAGAFLDPGQPDVAHPAEQRHRRGFVGQPPGLLAQRLHVEIDSLGSGPSARASRSASSAAPDSSGPWNR